MLALGDVAVGKEKREVKLFKPNEEIDAAVRELATEKINTVVRNPDKLEREAALDAVKAEVVETLKEKFPADEFPTLEKEIGAIFYKTEKEVVPTAAGLKKFAR